MALFGLLPDATGNTSDPDPYVSQLLKQPFAYGTGQTPGYYDQNGQFHPPTTNNSAAQQIDKYNVYNDQLRNQTAPILTPTSTAGLANTVAAATGQQNLDRTAQQQQIAGLTNDQTGNNEAALGAQINSDLAGNTAGAKAQQGYIDRLNSDLNGGQPSVAEQQLKQGMASNMRNALSIAAGARGGAGNQAAALRTALNANATTGANTNAQAGQLRAQEYAQTRGELGQATTQQRTQQQADLGMLGSLYGQQRGQDLNAKGMALDATGNLRSADTAGAGLALGGQNAIAGINANQNAQQAQLDAQERALQLQGSLGYGNLENQVTNADTMARQSYAELMNSRDLAERGLAFNQQQANTAQSNYQTQQLLGLIGTGALFASDERLKTGVHDADPKLAEEMLSKMRAKSYTYKDPIFGEGEQFGILAQALESSTLGKRLVRDTPAGKMVDVPKSVGALLAIAAGMHERVAKLEGRA
ncbi:MAG TPA: tail fiber domain-containing protein [Xanthobacteraceae bacterium]|nr:tail fiber domain-containing protein [Xanthobacteraceae bacterium]